MKALTHIIGHQIHTPQHAAIAGIGAGKHALHVALMSDIRLKRRSFLPRPCGKSRCALSLTSMRGAGATKYANHILPLLLNGCQSPEASIRQSALYGLGAAAQQRPALFQAVAADALNRISAVVNAPNSR